MPEEKKLYIDEDWKSRVEAEKEELERKRREQPGAASARAAADEANAGEHREMQMPPASWEMLLTTLATEAMVWLGQIPHPATGQPERNLDQAKYFIDTLEVLEQKTKGNLTPFESQALEQLLHDLRMAFVAAEQQRPSPSASR
jgi:hypothetical protein